MGKMEVGYTVWCDCSNWDHTSGTKDIASKTFRACGWKNLKDRGWVCPECLKKIDEAILDKETSS